MGRIVAAVMLLAVPVLAGQQAPTIADSYMDARRALDRAIAAHGGEEALRRGRRVRIRMAGEDGWRHQSRRPAPPYDRTPFAGVLHMDLDAGRLVLDLSRRYPGGIQRHIAFVTAADRSLNVNHRHRAYTVENYPPADQQLNNLYFVPQVVLQLARDSGTRLRSLGQMRLSNGTVVEAIASSTANSSLTIGLEPATHRLRAVLVVRNDAVDGPIATEVEFLDYRDVNGNLTPGRRIVMTGGDVVEDYAYREVVYGEPVADELVAPPDGYALREAVETPPVRTLADNVWLIGSGSASLVVALGDDVIVIDAAPSAAASVAGHVAKLLPGRKVTHVVPTHHHDDHAPGIRTLARDGAAVLTTPDNKALFERMIGSPVQIIEGRRRIFTAGDRSLELHDIGPSPHAGEMLVAWLPKERILFEADLIDATASGVSERGANNETTMHFARWLADRGWTPRVFAGAHGAVIDAAAFTRLAATALSPTAQDR